MTRKKQLFISTDFCIFYSCKYLRISTDFYGFLRISTDFYGFLLKTVYFVVGTSMCSYICQMAHVWDTRTALDGMFIEVLGHSACPNVSKCINELIQILSFHRLSTITMDGNTTPRSWACMKTGVCILSSLTWVAKVGCPVACMSMQPAHTTRPAINQTI